MGMSASQARLLTLTARLSDLELKAQQISNNKIRLAMDSEKVSRDYSDALDKESITLLTGYNGTNPQYAEVDYNNLTGVDSPLMTQYGVSDSNGNLLVTNDMASKYVAAAGNVNTFLTSYNALGKYVNNGDGTDPTAYNNAQQAVVDTKAAYDAGKLAVKGSSYETALNALNAYGADNVEGYQGAGTWSYSVEKSNFNDLAVDMNSLVEYANVSGGTDYKANADAMQTLITKIIPELNIQIQNAFKALTSTELTSAEMGTMNWNNLSYISGGSGTTIKYIRAKSDVDVSTGAKAVPFYNTTNNGNVPSSTNVVLNAPNTTNYDATTGVGQELDQLIRMRRDLNTVSKLLTAYTLTGGTDPNAVEEINSAISLVLMGGNTGTYNQNNRTQTMRLLADGDDDGDRNGTLDDNVFAKYMDYNFNGLWSNTKGGATPYGSNTQEFTDNLYNIMNQYTGISTDKASTPIVYSSADSTTGLQGIRMKGGDVATYTSLLNTFKNTPLPTDTSGNTVNLTDLLNKYNAALDTFNAMTPPSTASYTKGTNEDYYRNLFTRMKDGYRPFAKDETEEKALMSNPAWLQNNLLHGNVIMEKVDSDGKWQKTSYSSDTNFVEKSDDRELAKAEAKYESDIAKIQSKDKRFDVQLTQINTEHSAIQTEMDSVKKVIDKNIERAFKIFEA